MLTSADENLTSWLRSILIPLKTNKLCWRGCSQYGRIGWKWRSTTIKMQIVSSKPTSHKFIFTSSAKPIIPVYQASIQWLLSPDTVKQHDPTSSRLHRIVCLLVDYNLLYFCYRILSSAATQSQSHLPNSFELPLHVPWARCRTIDGARKVRC